MKKVLGDKTHCLFSHLAIQLDRTTVMKMSRWWHYSKFVSNLAEEAQFCNKFAALQGQKRDVSRPFAKATLHLQTSN